MAAQAPDVHVRPGAQKAKSPQAAPTERPPQPHFPLVPHVRPCAQLALLAHVCVEQPTAIPGSVHVPEVHARPPTQILVQSVLSQVPPMATVPVYEFEHLPAQQRAPATHCELAVHVAPAGHTWIGAK